MIGSSDSSINNEVPNDINSLLKKTKIKKIYTTGKTAYKLYNKFIYKNTKINAEYLPSTSPANAKISLEDLIEAYKIINSE